MHSKLLTEQLNIVFHRTVVADTVYRKQKRSCTTNYLFVELLLTKLSELLFFL